jgi:2'-5' RNA ligase
VSEGSRPTTALIVASPEAEPVVAPWRRRYAAEAVERGVPPHITILVPLVAAAAVDADLLTRLRTLFAPIRPFDYELATVESFPAVVWLAPEPAAPFKELIARTREAFPEHPPYGDSTLEPVPHCTIGVDDDPTRVAAMLDEVRQALGPRLPIRCRATSIDLLQQRDDQSWLLRERFPLAGA